MVSEQDRALIKETVSRIDQVNELDVSGKEAPDCVLSFTTTFAGEAAYDLELTADDSGYEAVLFTSSETPLMRDHIDTISEDQIDSLLDHVLETIRELEGN